MSGTGGDLVAEQARPLEQGIDEWKITLRIEQAFHRQFHG